MHAYVINLRRRPERRERFLRWNAGKGLDFEFLDAVDGSGLDQQELIDKGLLSAKRHLFNHGSLGNALSHRAAWEMAVWKGENIVVFEDDAYIHRRTAGLLGGSVAHRKLGADILYLGYNRDAAIAISFAPDAWSRVSFFKMEKNFEQFASGYDALGDRYATRTYDVRLVWGTLGYVVSPQGAATLLAGCFPLASDTAIVMYGQGRKLKPYTLDGMMNVLFQHDRARARCFYPPLVVGPNEHTDSDVV